MLYMQYREVRTCWILSLFELSCWNLRGRFRYGFLYSLSCWHSAQLNRKEEFI